MPLPLGRASPRAGRAWLIRGPRQRTPWSQEWVFRSRADGVSPNEVTVQDLLEAKAEAGRAEAETNKLASAPRTRRSERRPLRSVTRSSPELRRGLASGPPVIRGLTGLALREPGT